MRDLIKNDIRTFTSEQIAGLLLTILRKIQQGKNEINGWFNV